MLAHVDEMLPPVQPCGRTRPSDQYQRDGGTRREDSIGVLETKGNAILDSSGSRMHAWCLTHDPAESRVGTSERPNSAQGLFCNISHMIHVDTISTRSNTDLLLETSTKLFDRLETTNEGGALEAPSYLRNSLLR